MRVALGVLVVALGAVLKVVGDNSHTSGLDTAGIVVMVAGVLGTMIVLMQSGPRRQSGSLAPRNRDGSPSGLTADPIDPNL